METDTAKHIEGIVAQLEVGDPYALQAADDLIRHATSDDFKVNFCEELDTLVHAITRARLLEACKTALYRLLHDSQSLKNNIASKNRRMATIAELEAAIANAEGPKSP